MPPPASQDSPPKSSLRLLLALVCASIVADYDRSWLTRPVAQLIPEGGPRPEWISRAKTKLQSVFADLVEAATRRGRRPCVSREDRTPVLGALLAVATRLLALSAVPVRRRAVQAELVCAFGRVHAEHGVTAREFCAHLALSERTFRSWQDRPAKPPPPPPPPSPPPHDRNTGRFDLGVTAPDTQLGGDTTDLRVLGIELKLVGIQDIGDRERVLFDAFAVNERESSALIERVLADAADGLAGARFITDQGTPCAAEAAQQAYEALGVEHAPQREGTPTEKATVERGFATVKNALSPILALLDRLVVALPQLQQPQLAKSVTTLLIATFLRVYATGRRHLGHQLDGQDPEVLRAIVEQQRETRAPRTAPCGCSSKRCTPSTRCPAPPKRWCARSAAIHSTTSRRPSAASAAALAAAMSARAIATSPRSCATSTNTRGDDAPPSAASASPRSRHAAIRGCRRSHRRPDAHPERRLLEGLDVLADTWLPHSGEFVAGAQLARLWLRRAVDAIFAITLIGAIDVIEAHVRSWPAGRPDDPTATLRRRTLGAT